MVPSLIACFYSLAALEQFVLPSLELDHETKPHLLNHRFALMMSNEDQKALHVTLAAYAIAFYILLLQES